MSSLHQRCPESSDSSEPSFAAQSLPTATFFTAIDLWLEETEANPGEDVTTLPELALDNEAERRHQDLEREEAEKEHEATTLHELAWQNEVERVGWNLMYEEEAEKELLRKFEALHGADEAYNDTVEEQHRQQMREEAGYEDAYYDTLANEKAKAITSTLAAILWNTSMFADRRVSRRLRTRNIDPM